MKTSRRPFSVFFLVLLALGIGFSGISSAKDKSPAFHGWVSQIYKWRTTGSASDHDSETMVTLDIGDPTTDRFSGSIQGGVIIDLNGRPANDIFRGIYDTFSSRAVGRLYYAYLDVRDINPINNVRAGRQHIYEIESVYFDGVSFETEPYLGFTLSGFGGVPVHLYENQFGFDPGDWTAGFAVQWNPVSRLRFRFNFTHLTDDTSAFRITQNDQSDNLWGAAAWLDLTSNWDIYGRLTGFTDQLRDIEAASAVRFPKQDLKLELNVRRLINSYAVRVVDWDVFGVAGAYQPYTEVMFTVTKGIGKHFTVDGGAGARFLDNNQNASAFNHGYKKFFVSVSSHDVLIKGLSSTVTADFYRGEDNSLRNNYFGISSSTKLSLLKKKLILGVGSAYYLYHFNLYTGNESMNARTYFASVEGSPVKHLKIKGGYEFEKNSINAFHSGRVSVVWDF